MHRFYVLVILLCMSFVTLAEENTIEVRTIGISPYGIDNDGELSGVYFDLANLLFSKKNNINHYIYPYARIIHELKIGQTDLTIMFKYKELEDYVTYIAPLPPLQNVVVGLFGDSITSIEDLEGESLAYLRGANFSNEIESNSAITLYRTRDFKKSIAMLSAGRVKAVVGPYEALQMAAKSLGKSKYFLGEGLVVSERTPWLQISNKSKHKFDTLELEKRFKTILKGKSLEHIKKKYLSQK